MHPRGEGRRRPVHRLGVGVRAHRRPDPGPPRAPVPARLPAPASPQLLDADPRVPGQRPLPAGRPGSEGHRSRGGPGRGADVLPDQGRPAARPPRPPRPLLGADHGKVPSANWTPRVSTGRPTSAPASTSATGRPPTPRPSARPAPSSAGGAGRERRLMPATVRDDPPGIWCVFSDGSTAEFGLDGLPNPRLARDLAVGLVELVHPHGTVDTAGSVDHYVRSLRRMVRVLAEQGFSGGAGDLRRGQAAQFWMAGPTHVEAMTRSLVEGFARSGGVLGEGVLELAARPALQHPAQPAAAASLPGSRVGTADRGLPGAWPTRAMPPTGRRWLGLRGGARLAAGGRRRTSAACWAGPGRPARRSSPGSSA